MGMLGATLMFALKPVINMVVLPFIGELRPSTGTAEGARRVKLQVAALKFFGEVWGSLNPAEKFFCLVITVVAFLVFFFKVVGDMLNKWPNNAYFNCLLLFMYLSFDPMPHTTAYESFCASPVGKIMGLYVPKADQDAVKKDLKTELSKVLPRGNKSPVRKKPK